MSKAIEGAPFASLLTKRGRFYSDPGSEMRNDYEIQIDKKGHKALKRVGEHNIYQEIQSYAEECKIENIIARASAGDQSLLNQRAGFYADITQSPKSLAEAQNAILKLSAGFDNLPADIRAKFDNSKERFVNLFGTEEWAKYMGFGKTEEERAERVSFTPEAAEVKDQILTPEVK